MGPVLVFAVPVADQDDETAVSTVDLGLGFTKVLDALEDCNGAWHPDGEGMPDWESALNLVNEWVPTNADDDGGRLSEYVTADGRRGRTCAAGAGGRQLGALG